MADTNTVVDFPKQKKRRRTARTGLIEESARAFDSRISAFLDYQHKAYHSAATMSDKFDMPISIGPNAANGEIPVARARSRQAKVNSSYYKNGIRQLVNNVLGSGITPVISSAAVQRFWDRSSRDLDITGKMDRDELIAHAAEAYFTDGEVFVVFLDTSKKKYKSRTGIKFRLAVWEADHCPIGWNRTLENGNYVRDGVEVDDLGNVVAYWLYTHHPNDTRAVGIVQVEPTRFEAEHVIHWYTPDRPGALRGKPMAAASILTLEMLRRYLLNEVEKKAVQSKPTIFYTSPTPEEGDGWTDDDGPLPEFVNPPSGSAVTLPPGHEVKFAEMPPTDSNFAPYIRSALVEVALDFGLSVEMLSYELVDVNERAMRIQLIVMRKFFEKLAYGVFVPGINRIHNHLVTHAILEELLVLEPGLMLDDVLEPEWMMAPKDHIYPEQEADAQIKLINAGLSSPQQSIAALGLNAKIINKQNAEAFAQAKRDGTVYSTFNGWEPRSGDTPQQPNILDNIGAISAAVNAGLITKTPEIEDLLRQQLGLPHLTNTTVAAADAAMAGE